MASPDEMAAKVYEKYPRKVGKVAAIKAIHKAAKARMKAGDTERNAYAHLFRVVCLYARSAEVISREKQFIPYPATWFNAGRYDDDPAEWQTGKVGEPVAAKPREGLWESGWTG
jgi:hypothetical protein